jgi:rhamnosyl/mannosyltransferase
MRKVLQISKYYFPFLGGTEQVARDIAKALNNYEDVEQKIICFNEDAKLDGYVNHHEETVKEEVDGVEVIRCGYVAKYASQALSTSYGRELKKVINEFDPDLIILHYPNPFVTYYLLKYIKPHCKLAVYWHLDITKQKVLKHLFNGQNKKLIARSSKILGATPVHVNESAYSEVMGNKKYILPYAIDEKRLVISDEEKKRAEDIRKKYEGKVLGFFIGRHVPYKGLRYLIEASSKIDGDKIHFLIAGTGELTEELKRLSANDPKVEFVGRVTDSEWRSYLYACDIFCFPSITRNEGFGLAQAEAMYYEKPVVTFTIKGSGVNYVTQDGITGIECPNCDSSAYAGALSKLANDAVLRENMGKAGRQRVLDNFTEAQFVKNVGRLLDEIINV